MRAQLRMNRRTTIALALALLATAATVAGSPAAAATRVARAHRFVPHELIVKRDGQPTPRTRELPAGVGVREAVAALRRDPAVDYAAPNFLATASVTESGPVPNDPGTLTGLPGVPGGWVSKQWNFLPWEGPGTPTLPTSPGGIDAIGAWENLQAVKRPGGRDVTVAVLDTGIAYRDSGRFLRSPDFTANQFAKGFDYVDDDRVPLDENGHGTHIAGTIAEHTNNGVALTGLAYRAKLMPVRVLDRNGRGQASDIAKGIRFAVAHGADVINMSFNFRCGNTVPPVAQAMHFAYRRGTVLVASIGNGEPRACITMPATDSHAIAVGGTTEDGCLGSYSRVGPRVDLVAPGGGLPVASCPTQTASRPIFQLTFRTGRPKQWAIPSYYEGTSMSAAHVTGVAAMVIASGVIGPNPSPAQVLDRLQSTARDLGDPGRDDQFGSGLIDAAAATKR